MSMPFIYCKNRIFHPFETVSHTSLTTDIPLITQHLLPRELDHTVKCFTQVKLYSSKTLSISITRIYISYNGVISIVTPIHMMYPKWLSPNTNFHHFLNFHSERREKPFPEVSIYKGKLHYHAASTIITIFGYFACNTSSQYLNYVHSWCKSRYC